MVSAMIHDRYESHVALDGGKDGLHVIGQILKNAHTLLKPNGLEN